MTPTVLNLYDGRRYSMMAAANAVEGFLVSACLCLNVTDTGGITAHRFMTWFKAHLLPHLGKYSRNQKNSIVVLDNCNIHNYEEVLRV